MELNNWNANQIGEDKVEIFLGWENFKNAQGAWQSISRLITDAGGDFVMNNAPFSCTFPRWSHAIATMTTNCRYDIWKKEDITADPYTITIRARETAEVKGKLFDMHGTGVFDAVIYEGAYPQWDADLIYYVHHGRAPRLKKLIRYNSHPLVAHRPKFFIDTSHSTELSSRNIPNGMTRRQHRDACKVILDSLDGDLQPVPLEADGGFYCRKDGEKQKRGIGIKDATLWDSGVGGNQKKRIIPSSMRRRDGHYTFVKRVPAQWFDDAVFPCYTDGEFTFYPDPHPETSSVDGIMGRWPGDVSWNNLSRGNGTLSADSVVQIGCRWWEATSANTWAGIDRSGMVFDTSSVSDVITAATLSVYGDVKIDNIGRAGDFFVNITGFAPASNTALVAADYQTCSHTTFSSAIAYADISLTGYNDFILGSNGIAAIGSDAAFTLRTTKDIDDITPSHTGGLNSHILIWFDSADGAGGTSKAPKLVLTVADATMALKAVGSFGMGKLGLRI